MRYLVSCGLVLFVASAVGLGADPPGKKGLVVHEWGVFRVTADEAVANANVRQDWDSHPAFVYGNIQGRGIPQHWLEVEIRDRPLVFFHAAQPEVMEVKVEFPGGMPGVWWPGTVRPAVIGNAKPPPVGTSLEWHLAIKAVPPGWANPSLRDVPRGHWFESARAVKCDDVFARFGDGSRTVEREKFLFYDGIFPAGKWLSIAVDKDAVQLTNRGAKPVFDVTVVDRRTDGKVRVGRIPRIDGLSESVAVEFAGADAAKFPQEGAATLVQQLTEVGLFEDEARLLADTWKHDMFVRPGMHVFYRIPKEEYDRCMPLTMKPPPEKVVRVGLIFHGNVEPDLADKVAALVKKLDAEDFQARNAAEEKLRAIGPAALPHLLKIRKEKDLSAEVKKRVDAMLKDWSAKEAF